MNNEPTTSRRDTLKGIGAALGAAGATGLAGCTSVLEDNDNHDNNSEDRPPQDTNTTDEPDSGPEYNEVVDVPGNADLTSSDSYSFTAGVERTEGSESEILPEDSYEVTEAYVMRDPEVLEALFFDVSLGFEDQGLEFGDLPYNGPEEVARDAGFHRDVVDDLETGDGEYSLPSDALLPGTNKLFLEVEYSDGEESGSFTVDESIRVQKSQDETMSEAWIEDRELFEKLRENYRIQINNGATSDWNQLTDDVDEIVNDNYDMDSLPVRDRLQRTASHWILEASDLVGGPPSGQAPFLGYTLEELEGVETTIITTSGHHTVLAYDRDSDKTYHVETGRGGRTNFPPGKYNHASSNPEISPIWPEQGDQIGGAMTTMLLLGELNPSMYGDSRRGFVGEETAISGMARFREGTDQEEMVDEMQFLNLSMALSPSLDFKVEGDIEDMERSIEY